MESEGRHSQMAGNVGKIEVVWTDELNGRTFEHGIVLLAYKTCVLYRFVDDVAYISVRAYNSYIVLVRIERVQSHICTVVSLQQDTRTQSDARCPIKNRIPIRLM